MLVSCLLVVHPHQFIPIYCTTSGYIVQHSVHVCCLHGVHSYQLTAMTLGSRMHSRAYSMHPLVAVITITVTTDTMGIINFYTKFLNPTDIAISQQVDTIGIAVASGVSRGVRRGRSAPGRHLPGGCQIEQCDGNHIKLVNNRYNFYKLLHSTWCHSTHSTRRHR